MKTKYMNVAVLTIFFPSLLATKKTQKSLFFTLLICNVTIWQIFTKEKKKGCPKPLISPLFHKTMMLLHTFRATFGMNAV
jgi:hypothetical protein